jgi:hypothetical protein
MYLWSQKEYSIRYIPVLKELSDNKGSYRNILEIGSGPLGLSRLILDKVVAVDISTSGPHFDNVALINSSATALPFEDNSFDFVVSMDMLEHIPREQRERVVDELFRVTRKKFYLGMPCGHSAEKIEEKIWGKYSSLLEKWRGTAEDKKTFTKRNSFLFEHHEHGLPKEEEVIRYIKGNINDPNQYKISILNNEGIFVWYWAILSHMKYSYLRWLLTTIIFIVFFPILSRTKWGGYYRKIFVVEKQS